MKNTYKKITAIATILIMFITYINVTNAFTKMDICNYTDGDHSGNYYDGYCTKNGDLAEEEDKYNFPSKNINIITKNIISKLKHVDAYNGSSSNIFRNSNTQNSEEIKKLKETISKQNLLINKYKDENSKLKQYVKYISEKTKKKVIIKKVIDSSNINYKVTIQDINTSNLSREDRKEYIRQLIIKKNK